MALVSCPVCGKVFSELEGACSECGFRPDKRKIQEEAKKANQVDPLFNKKKIAFIVFAAILFCLSILVLIQNIGLVDFGIGKYDLYDQNAKEEIFDFMADCSTDGIISRIDIENSVIYVNRNGWTKVSPDNRKKTARLWGRYMRIMERPSTAVRIIYADNEDLSAKYGFFGYREYR